MREGRGQLRVERQRNTVKWTRIVFWNYLILILIITIFPFNFSFTEIPEKFSHGWEYFLTGLSPQRYTLMFDILMNVLVFIPLSALWRAGFGGKKKKWYKPVGIGFLISLAIELLQFFLPYRFPSLTDLCTNTAGALIGGFIPSSFTTAAIGLAFQDYFGDKVTERRQKIWRWWLAVYIIIVFILLVGGLNQITLKNWDQHFPLQIGNEANSERAWRGTIHEISLWDSVLPNETIKANSIPFWHINFRNADSTLLQKMQSEGWVLFQPEKISLDKNGLALRGGWLQNNVLGQAISRQLREKGKFTLEVTVGQAAPQNSGPARIISLSPDHDRCNFMLGQYGATLCFRLRTPVSGDNGDNPVVWQPDFFSNDTTNKIAIEFDGNELRLLKNNQQTESKMRYVPEAALLRNIFHIQASRFILFERLYYWILFYPLAIIAAPAFRRNTSAYMLMLLGICATYWSVIEIFAPHSIILSNFLLSMLALAVAGTGFYRPLNLSNIN
jgi:glycopeptide antibiotics resistance protein